MIMETDDGIAHSRRRPWTQSSSTEQRSSDRSLPRRLANWNYPHHLCAVSRRLRVRQRFPGDLVKHADCSIEHQHTWLRCLELIRYRRNGPVDVGAKGIAPCACYCVQRSNGQCVLHCAGLVCLRIRCVLLHGMENYEEAGRCCGCLGRV